MKGLLGRKVGMTTVFANDGRAIPVTVIEVKPNAVLQVKTAEVDGYIAIKLGVEDKKEQRATRAALGEAKKANTSAKYFIKEIRNMQGYELGQTVKADVFEIGELVDVIGTSKGKGFQGSIKRHNQARGPMGHGSKSHRVTGSIGDIRGHVIKGKNMPGHMGHEKITVQNLEVVSIDLGNNLILLKGSIPGPNKSFVIIKEKLNKKILSKSIELIDVKIEKIKNELIEDAKKVGAIVTSAMKVEEMKEIISAATIKHEANLKEHKELLEKAKKLEISKADKMKLDALRIAVVKAEKIMAARAATKPVVEAKVEDKKEES